MNRTRIGAACALLAALASCTSTYSSRYVFAPRPLDIELAAAEGKASPGRAVVSVVGLRNAKDGRPAEMHLRLRLENLDDETFVLDPERIVLLSAGLDEFGPVRIEPEPDMVAPGEHSVTELYFGLPRRADEMDLSGLNLRFGLRTDAATILVDATFERMSSYYHDPYWGPRSRFSFSYGVSVHH